MDQTIHPFSERVLRDMNSAVLVLDGKGCVVYANGPAACMLEMDEGYREERNRFQLVTDQVYNDRFYETILDALYHKDQTILRKVPYMAPSGRKYTLLLSSSYLREPGQDGAQLVMTMSDETAAEEMKRKLNDSSNTFTTFLFCLSGWILFYALWEFLGRPFSADYMTHGVEVLGLIMLAFILRRTSLTWGDLGIAARTPARTVRTALICALCAVAFLCGLKGISRLINPESFEPAAPFIDFSRFGLRQILYVLTAGIQEFLARSVMQGNLKRILPGKHPAVTAILLSSLIFAMLHIHLGFLFMVGAAVLAGLEGILYEKQGNMLGVWIVHWFFGVSGTLLCLIDH